MGAPEDQAAAASPSAWVIGGPIVDVGLLCEGLRVRIGSSTEAVIVCDVRSLPADGLTLDALARLELTARRLDRRLSLAGASADLLALLSFAGLAGVVGPATPPGSGPGRRGGRSGPCRGSS